MSLLLSQDIVDTGNSFIHKFIRLLIFFTYFLGGVLDLMFLLRTLWIPDLVNELVENFSFVRKLGNLGVLVKLLFMTTLLAHFFGSAFHYIAAVELD